MKLQVERNNPNGLVRVRILDIDIRIFTDSQPIGPFETVGYDEPDALYRLHTLLKKTEETLRQVFNVGSPIDGVKLTAPLRTAIQMVGFRRGLLSLSEKEPLTYGAVIAEGRRRAFEIENETAGVKV